MNLHISSEKLTPNFKQKFEAKKAEYFIFEPVLGMGK